ncbi:rhodanese-like domain-containing protein [Zooshikella sp. RANM57]|uniref:rhodanese-like domain-containing protein n=1 Tax=Zooshikella sp. RANM57 TaxID=3425863 RepID=UPI003D6EBBE6
MPSPVARPYAANSSEALAYFESLLKFETDCWDVHFAITNNRKDFVLLDVRSEQAYDKGHIKEAINLPYPKINQKTLMDFSDETLFIVYCAGPHCNAADKAAIKLAKLNRPVKKMIGGLTGWVDEGFSLISKRSYE